MRFLAFSAVGLLVACSFPTTDPRSISTTPDRASFPPVAKVLVHDCGSLDCHGQISRNLRLFGNEGLRLSPTDRPSNLPTDFITKAELDEDFASVAGLEPEVMTAVVTDKGARPERLTLVRKARGQEAHKGGAPIAQGDDADTCITSWLAGAVDAGACGRAAAK